MDDSEALIDRLTEEIFEDALKYIEGMGSTHDGKPKEIVSNQFCALVELNIGHNFSE